jgi:hypothetical protein
MKKNLSQSQETAVSANKLEPLEKESEPIEPHELAGKMTPEQMRQLIKELMDSKRPPSPNINNS